MFRKPKRKGKMAALRSTKDDEDDEGDVGEESTTELLQAARKRVKTTIGTTATTQTATAETKASEVLQSYQAKDGASSRELVTSIADHHPQQEQQDNISTAEAIKKDDGIFRNTTRNKFHAGPIRAATNIRTTVQFDYQPDVCKDYKETGFCGFGDTCIYLHDRGDTLSGWQLEQQWEDQQKKKKEQQEKEMNNFTNGGDETGDDQQSSLGEDGIPFACHICRDYFKNPVVTNCMHYFCEECIMNQVRSQSEGCPICGKDTGSVFNQPNKLIAKKKKLLGSSQAKEEDSWQEYAKLFRKKA